MQFLGPRVIGPLARDAAEDLQRGGDAFAVTQASVEGECLLQMPLRPVVLAPQQREDTGTQECLGPRGRGGYVG